MVKNGAGRPPIQTCKVLLALAESTPRGGFVHSYSEIEEASGASNLDKILSRLRREGILTRAPQRKGSWLLSMDPGPAAIARAVQYFLDEPAFLISWVISPYNRYLLDETSFGRERLGRIPARCLASLRFLEKAESGPYYIGEDSYDLSEKIPRSEFANTPEGVALSKVARLARTPARVARFMELIVGSRSVWQKLGLMDREVRRRYLMLLKTSPHFYFETLKDSLFESLYYRRGAIVEIRHLAGRSIPHILSSRDFAKPGEADILELVMAWCFLFSQRCLDHDRDNPLTMAALAAHAPDLLLRPENSIVSNG